MFAKLSAVILVLGATSAALLVFRQQRLGAAREAALLHEEILAQESRIRELRYAIAAASSPQELRLALDRIHGPWEPIVLASPRAATALALAPGALGTMR